MTASGSGVRDVLSRNVSTESDALPPGWLRYLVHILVPAPLGYDGDDAMLQFWAMAPTAPRVGECLDFDGPGNGLSLTVTAVEHCYSLASDTEHPHYKLVIDAEIDDPLSVRTAQELFLDKAKWVAWTDQFPMVQAYRFGLPPGSCEVCAGTAGSAAPSS